VAIDTHDCWARLTFDESRAYPTPRTDGKTTRTYAEEKNKGSELGATFTASLSPSGQVTGKITQNNKVTSTSQVAELDSRTTVSHRLGVAWWGFTIRDSNLQDRCYFPNERLPTLYCDFSPTVSVPAKIHIEVASYWFSPFVEKYEKAGSNFFHKLWEWFGHRKAGTETTRPPPYYNFCHVVDVEIPPDMEETFKEERQEEVNFIMPETTDGKFEGNIIPGRGTGDLPITHEVLPANKKYRILDIETQGEQFLFERTNTY
jgi:hypothetical protein